MKIIELVINDITKDVRVQKTASSLAEEGHDVTVISFSENQISQDFPFKVLTENRCNTVGSVFGKFQIKDWIMYRIKEYYYGINFPTVRENRIIDNVMQIINRFISSNIILGYVINNNIVIYEKAHDLAADIYHANDLDTLFAAFMLRWKYGGKIVYDSHELYCDQWSNFDPLVHKIMESIEWFLTRRCDGIMTVNESIALEMQKRYNLKQKPSVVMNCPRLNGRFVPIEHESPRIIYVGGYMKNRGLENLIMATKYMKEPVYLRGYGDLEYKLRTLASDKYNVHFLDPVPSTQIVETLKEFDVGVVPYQPTNTNNLYATPNKFFEYMHAGLAVAGSDIPELRKIINEENVGGVFDPDNPESIARCLKNVIEENLMEYRKNAVRCSIEKYNWDRQKKNMLELYNNI